MTANAATRLLQHYVDNYRRLPWRSSPGAPPPDPYRVWLSEVMLQQTTVAAVAPRFARFVDRWPTLDALAAAPDEDVLGEWAGLGYYARARNLIACARALHALGGFPRTAAELRRLPGIGEYTAGAIASIAFGEAVPAVDTNVTRVVARLRAMTTPTPGQVAAAVAALMPADRAGDFTQALMDLGATICLPRRPRCNDCPLQRDCAAFASGTPEEFPQRRAKAPRAQKYGTAWWIERDGAVWLVRRPQRGMLGGMAALPGDDWSTQRGADPPVILGRVHHVFTHFALELILVPRQHPTGEGWWQPLDRLDEAGLPTLYRRAAALAAAADHSARRAA